MSFLRHLFLFSIALLLAMPGAAVAADAPDKSFLASISANTADGSPLLALVLGGQCEFDPAPVCRVTVQDMHIDTPLFSGAATGTAVVELAPEELVLRELDLDMKSAEIRMNGTDADDAGDGTTAGAAPKSSVQSVDLKLTGQGKYVPETNTLDLSRVRLVTSRGLTLSGAMTSSPHHFSASLGVNVSRPAALASLLGLAPSARASLPTGPVVLKLTASGDGDSFGPVGINLLTTASLAKAVTLGEGGFTLPPLSLKARIRTNQPDWPLLVTLLLPGGPLEAGVEMGEDGSGRVMLKGERLDMSQLWPFVQQFGATAGADWNPGGTLGLHSDIRLQDGSIEADTRVKLRGLAYMSPLANYMAQGVTSDLRLKTRLDTKTGKRRVNGTLTVPSGEFLFGSAYLNMKENPLAVDCNAEQLAPRRFKNLKADIRWKGFGRVRGSGDVLAEGPVDQWTYSGGLAATDIVLEKLFDTAADAFALTNFQGEHGLTGTAWLTLRLRSDGKEADCEGRLAVNDAALTTADGSLELRGASLELPIAYRLAGPVVNVSPQYVEPKAWGELHADLVRAPFVEMTDSSTALALVPNRFFIRDALTLSVLDGRVRLSGIQVDRPFSRFKVTLGARLDGLDLSAATKGAFPLEGRVDGNLGTVTLTEEKLVVPGSLKGRFFGGDLLVDRIFAENPLADHRKLGVSVTVREMDLERISTAMDVGRVAGKMDLDLHDVVVAYGEPVGMVLRAETSGEGDFERSVSLKAVNSLSVIGTGSGLGDVGVGMFASFFEEFSYERIGFQCTLNNDTFRVRGLIQDGGVEYLIKKPWLMGINVVNSNPKNTISFKDMLERVQRVIGKEE